ncbi:30S ribosomal protein S16 [Mediannikoviicoccus vaginalis]|uniref:30S ribosomal protein S16 n=1 Tax=Mediannikoviicoccus vaginalis TaxID=2899727 RepID=UPI001F00829D
MAVKIRLKRMGSKKNPFYRIVVADIRAPRDGKFIEEIGYYNPLTEPKVVKVDAEKVNKWIKNGAKPTDTVHRLFKENGVYEEKAQEAKKEVVEEVETEESSQEVAE